MFQFPQHTKRVFKDPNMQSQFEQNGYVIFDFYDEEEIEYLSKLYAELHPKDEVGFYPSTFSKDKEYRQKTDDEIRRIGGRTMSNVLVDYKVVCGSFIVKKPGPESVMGVHQDMTLVDETEFTGINIWCPLVDLTDTNGVLKVIPKSHRIFPTYRGSSIPNIYDNVHEEILNKATPVYLKAGQAIAFDQSIIHCSPPNVSDKKRIVTNIYFSHKDVRFRTAFYPKETHPDKIELFEQDISFMTNFEQFGQNIFKRPEIGKSLGFVAYNFPVLTMEDIDRLNPESSSLLSWIKKLFS